MIVNQIKILFLIVTTLCINMLLQGTIININEACAIRGECEKVFGGCNQTCVFAGLNAARSIVQLKIISEPEDIMLIGKVALERPLSIKLKRKTMQQFVSYIPTQGKLAGKEQKIVFFLIRLADASGRASLPRIMQREIDVNQKKNPWASYVLYIFKQLDQKFFMEIGQAQINEIPEDVQLSTVLYPDGNFSMVVPAVFDSQAAEQHGERKILIDVKSIE